MGGGVSKPKKVTPDRAEATAAILSALEANLPDEEVAAKCKEKRNIDASFRMNLMYHEEDGWGLLHVACSARCVLPLRSCPAINVARSEKRRAHRVFAGRRASARPASRL